MAQNSKIEWTTHTFNPWVGCTKVSPACDHCYAEGWAKRTGHPELWAGERRRTTGSNWQQPVRWNAAAAAAGRRDRVFCASLADVFDNQVPARWRDDLWHMIEQTPHLDWLLLTKRPQNIAKFLPDPRTGTKPWGDGWPNVWLGTTVENQHEADRRIPLLLAVPARIRFLSCEPLLGPIDLTRISPPDRAEIDALRGFDFDPGLPTKGLDWIIAGGESGPRARPTHTDWVRSLRDQCADAGVPFFFKQWGEWRPSGGWIDGVLEPGTHGVSTGGQVARAGDLMCGNVTGEEWAGYSIIRRVGKKAAGRLLGGVEHNGMPQGRAAV